MIKDTIGRVRPEAGALARLLLALAAWRRRAMRRRKRGVDCLSDHMRRDIGFPRWEPERHMTDWLYRG